MKVTRRDYWNTVAIKRWQLLTVYVLVVAAFAVTATWAFSASHTAQQAANQIQQERYDNIVRACQEVNRRHDAVIATVSDAPARANVDKKVVVQIVTALAPKRNCVELARASTDELPGG